MSPEEFKRARRDPWRVRCPEGHVPHRAPTTDDMVRCWSCNQRYPLEDMVDWKEQDREVAVRDVS